MRALQIVSEFAYPATATTSASSAIVLTAGEIGTQLPLGDEAVPGEDMGFPSSGSCVCAVELEGVTSNAGDTVNVQTSNNYYANLGGTPTYATVKSVTITGLTAKSKTLFLDRAPLGEAVRISITTTSTAGAGTVSAYLLSE